jgi:hypothetical protein
MTGLTEHKTYSWLKHVVRRWKELYYEILETDGQDDWINPLREIFSQESLAIKAIEVSSQPVPESAPTAQESTSPSEPTPTSQPDPQTKRKRRQGRFTTKIKEIQAFPIFPGSFF